MSVYRQVSDAIGCGKLKPGDVIRVGVDGTEQPCTVESIEWGTGGIRLAFTPDSPVTEMSLGGGLRTRFGTTGDDW